VTGNVSTRISLLKKAQILVFLSEDRRIDKLLSQLGARDLLELRNFLEQELTFLAAKADNNVLNPGDLKSKYEPIPNYYYRQDCREPLESCYNETCLAADPDCFGQKMYGQIIVLSRMVKQYLGVESETELEEIA